MGVLISGVALLLLATSAVAQVAGIDLKPYGFLPTKNVAYLPEFNSSAVTYLTDGSLVVGFRLAGQMMDKTSGAQRERMPVRLLRFDARTGKLLARTDTTVEHGVAFLLGAPENNVLLPGMGTFVLLNAALRETGRFDLPADTDGVDVAVGAGSFAVGVKRGANEHIQVVTLPRFQSSKEFEIEDGAPMALLSDGWASLREDGKDDFKLVFTRNGSEKQRITQLPMRAFDCHPTMGKVPGNAVLLNACDRFWVYDENANPMLEANLRFDDTVVAIASSSAAERFALIMIEGYSRADLVKQRIFGESFRVTVYDLKKGAEVRTIKVKPMPKLGGAFALSPDGKTLALLKDGAVEQVALDSVKK